MNCGFCVDEHWVLGGGESKVGNSLLLAATAENNWDFLDKISYKREKRVGES